MKKKMTLICLLVVLVSLFLGIGYASVTSTLTGTLDVKTKGADLEVYFVNSENSSGVMDQLKIIANKPDAVQVTPKITLSGSDNNVLSKVDSMVLNKGRSKSQATYGKYGDSFNFTIDGDLKPGDVIKLYVPIINLSSDLDASITGVHMERTSTNAECDKILTHDAKLYYRNDFVNKANGGFLLKTLNPTESELNTAYNTGAWGNYFDFGDANQGYNAGVGIILNYNHNSTESLVCSYSVSFTATAKTRY